MPSGNVAIPSRYYKILLRTTNDGTLEALTIVLPNLQRGLPLPPGSFFSGSWKVYHSKVTRRAVRAR